MLEIEDQNKYPHLAAFQIREAAKAMKIRKERNIKRELWQRDD